MRSRSVIVALVVSFLAGVGAASAWYRASVLRTEADLLMARGNAHASEYAATLESAHAQTQLATFEQRRVVLESSHIWQRIQYLLVLTAVVAAFSSYVLFLFKRLRDQLIDGAPDLGGV